MFPLTDQTPQNADHTHGALGRDGQLSSTDPLQKDEAMSPELLDAPRTLNQAVAAPAANGLPAKLDHDVQVFKLLADETRLRILHDLKPYHLLPEQDQILVLERDAPLGGRYSLRSASLRAAST